MGALRKQAVSPRPNLELVQEYRDNLAAKELYVYQRRIEKYGTNPLLTFALTYLQHMMVFQDGPKAGQFVAPSPVHQDLTGRIHSALSEDRKMPRICGGYARDHAKTSYGTLALALRAIAVYGKRNVLILCSTKDEAKDRIRNIVEELETNELLQRDYPDLIPAKDAKNQTKAYTDYQVILANGARIKAYEAGKGKLRGTNWNNARPDLTILDDPEHEDIEYSETYRDRFWHWLQAVLLRAITLHCPVVWLGTPIGGNSQLMRARRRPGDAESPGLGWRGPWVPAAVELDGDGNEIPWSETPPLIPWKPTSMSDLEEIREEDPQRADQVAANDAEEAKRWYRPVWPTRYSAYDIALMLNEGEEAVAQQELMLRPVNRTKSPFDVAWFDEHKLDPALLKRVKPGVFTYDNVRLSRPRAHIDSGLSSDPNSDYTAIAIGAQHPVTKKVLLLKLYYVQLDVPEQFDLLMEAQEYYGMQVITAQKSQMETVLTQLTRRIGNLPMELVSMSNAVNAKDRRIRNHAPSWRSARILRNPADEEQQGIRKEMKHYPAKNDDALDAIEQLMFWFDESGGGDFSASDIKVQPVSSEATAGMGGW